MTISDDKRDNGKASWVEFLRSISFSHRSESGSKRECASHFADFNPQARPGRQSDAEDSYLIRSGN